ncbi:beta-ketoacyl-[acyl-carrier-protein] synthase family protein [Crocinitomix catalasitica]|nr:beta-ketoacyl-[acyl-carrier-protein] synthase family protein [Crocinitomix catalasitica]
MSRRVVITGMGIYSCLGKNLAEVKESLYDGKSGIGIDPTRKEFGYRSALTGLIEEPDLKGILPRRARIQLSQQAKYAYLATKEALDYTNLGIEDLEKREVGILYGNDSSAMATIEAVQRIREKGDTTLLGSASIFQSMNCTVTMNLSTIFKLKGINFTVSAACASGSHSIGIGFLLIQMGLQDMIICGGAQEVNPFVFGSFDGLSAFSIREDEPTKASRPFDKDRDGLVPSGGGATIIIETLESAEARGADVIAEITGYGFSSNGDHISNPNKDGQLRSLRMALKQARIDPSAVDYINAHATSTPVGDSFEAEAINEVFAGCETPVSSTKSLTGHECWMAGASEIVYSLIMMQNNFIAPNINFENPDEESKNLNIIANRKDQELKIVLSNSFGFGGTNSTLILQKT